MKLFNTLILATLSFFSFNLNAQNEKPDHQLMWEIIAPNESQPSYLYGTMHIRDPRVFNFSDSVYVKIEECKHFALEVHPDTMIKTMIVDPFNNIINKRYAELTEDDEELEEISEELREKTGVDLSGLSEDNFDLIPFLLDKMFRKNEDKDTFLDAHLYHIARLLERNIIGLETIAQHRLALNSRTAGEVPDLKKFLKRKKQQKLVLDEMIEIYEAGDVEALFKYGNFKIDTVLAIRNNIMVNSSVPYIEDGGIFLAVGAAHLSGEQGMIALLRQKGYKVFPINATFSKKIINADLAERELDWVIEEYPKEGFSVSVPDHAFDYRPESVGGIITVRSYPDLGLGHFFFYSSVPIMVENYTLKEFEEESIATIKKQSKDFSQRYSEYDGYPMLQINYTTNGTPTLYRYIIKDNILYSFGLSKLARKGELNPAVAKRFFKSVKFSDIEKRDNELYTDVKGAFTVSTNLAAQKYDQSDSESGVKSTSEHINFIDPQSRMMHMILYSYYEEGTVLDNADDLFSDYASNFVSGKDSLIYEKENQRFGGKEILIESDDNTFVQASGFIRGNRMYQIISTGSDSDDNLQKAKEFVANFELIDYADYKVQSFENENFSTSFPTTPAIDTSTNYYLSFSDKLISYSAMDASTGINVLVNEVKISPYATYENIDSCFNKLKEIYVHTIDTLLISKNNSDSNKTEFNFSTRSDINQLHYNYNMYFDDDKLYEVYVIQDSAQVQQKAIDEFLNNFQLKKRPKKSILLRDSASVKRLLLNDLFDADTLKMIAAADNIYRFNFSKNESQNIVNRYTQKFNTKHPFTYHQNLVNFISSSNVSDYKALSKKIYKEKGVDQKLQLAVLKLLIQRDETDAILLAKELLQYQIPTSDDNWEITSIFYSNYGNLEKLKPLFPEIIELGATENTIILDDLFLKCLNEKVITYETLSSIHDLIESNCSTSFKKIDRADEYDTEKYGLVTLAGIASFDNKKESTLEIGEFLFQDTLAYFKLSGAKILLQQGESPDLSTIYEQFTSYGSILQMYDIERLYEDAKILPDSMQTLSKFATILAISYAEEDEYIKDPKLKILETYKDETHEHFFIECKYQYGYSDDDDKKEYALLLYAVLEIQEGAFVVPSTYDTYSNYRYLNLDDGDTYEEMKKDLVDYYESSKK